jgi:hypothetical protein
MVMRTSSMETVLNGPVANCAAVTTTWSMLPQLRKRSATLSSLVTSVATPVAPIFPATAFNRSALREAITTSAPSLLASSAAARPMPDEPPTTTTFLPASTIITFPFLQTSRHSECIDIRFGRLVRVDADVM